MKRLSKKLLLRAQNPVVGDQIRVKFNGKTLRVESVDEKKVCCNFINGEEVIPTEFDRKKWPQRVEYTLGCKDREGYICEFVAAKQ